MNCQTYIFGKLSSGFTAYPDDYAESIFHKFAQRSKTEGQITVHRDGSLMYYGYVRRLGASGEYIGFCILLNGVMFTHPTALFPVFENLVEEMAGRGKILRLSESGDLVSAIGVLADNLPEAERMINALKQDIQSLEHDVQKLPPVNYATGKDEEGNYAVTDDENRISKATARYNFTRIFKNKGNDTPNLAGYRAVLRSVNQRNQKLERKNRTLTRQKKQLGLVAILGGIAIIFIVSTFGFKNSLSHTQNELKQANQEIAAKNGKIDSLDSLNDTLRSKLNDKETELSDVKANLVEKETELSGVKAKLADKEVEISRLEDKLWEGREYLPEYLW